MSEVPKSFKDVKRGQDRFFRILSSHPEVKLVKSRLVRRDDGSWVEKGKDVRMCVDMMSLAIENAYDVAIVFSSDGDLAHAMRSLISLGKRVINAHLRGKESRALTSLVEHREIDKYLEGCWLEGKKVNPLRDRVCGDER